MSTPLHAMPRIVVLSRPWWSRAGDAFAALRRALGRLAAEVAAERQRRRDFQALARLDPRVLADIGAPEDVQARLRACRDARDRYVEQRLHG